MIQMEIAYRAKKILMYDQKLKLVFYDINSLEHHLFVPANTEYHVKVMHCLLRAMQRICSRCIMKMFLAKAHSVSLMCTQK